MMLQNIVDIYTSQNKNSVKFFFKIINFSPLNPLLHEIVENVSCNKVHFFVN